MRDGHEVVRNLEILGKGVNPSAAQQTSMLRPEC